MPGVPRGERTNGDCRGSAEDRRRRKQWLLDTFGDGETCACVHCGGTLDFESLTVDRIVPGNLGGRYTRDNIQPSCLADNIARADNPAWYPPFREPTAAELDAEGEAYEPPTPI